MKQQFAETVRDGHTSIQVVLEFQKRAVIAIVTVMEEWSSGDESLESSLVSEFLNI